jgi:hypothetical protein
MKHAHAILIGVLVMGCAPDKDISSTGESGVSDGSTTDDGSTTGDVPAACEQGWDAAFETLAEQAGGTYWYSALTLKHIGLGFSVWACTYRTTVEFVAGAPIRRTFELADVADELGDQCTEMPFVEDGAEAIGSMDATFDFPAYTMEQLYAGCCDLLGLEPADAYDFHFELDDVGIVHTCYAYVNECSGLVPDCYASVDGFSGFYELEEVGFGPRP